MTKEQEKEYQNVEVLKEILSKTVAGKKFRLDCGHYA